MSLEIMIDLQSIFNIASIAIGFVAAVCFCIGAATNGPSNIAKSSATILNANPATMRALSAQRAQYLVGALFLVASFALQVGVVLIPKETTIAVPFILQSRLGLLAVVLFVASAIAFFSIRQLTERTVQAAQNSLQAMIEEQANRRR